MCLVVTQFFGGPRKFEKLMKNYNYFYADKIYLISLDRDTKCSRTSTPDFKGLGYSMTSKTQDTDTVNLEIWNHTIVF